MKAEGQRREGLLAGVGGLASAESSEVVTGPLPFLFQRQGWVKEQPGLCPTLSPTLSVQEMETDELVPCEQPCVIPGRPKEPHVRGDVILRLSLILAGA